jgi:hypothetical protein
MTDQEAFERIKKLIGGEKGITNEDLVVSVFFSVMATKILASGLSIDEDGFTVRLFTEEIEEELTKGIDSSTGNSGIDILRSYYQFKLMEQLKGGSDGLKI